MKKYSIIVDGEIISSTTNKEIFELSMRYVSNFKDGTYVHYLTVDGNESLEAYFRREE